MIRRIVVSFAIVGLLHANLFQVALAYHKEFLADDPSLQTSAIKRSWNFVRWAMAGDPMK